MSGTYYETDDLKPSDAETALSLVYAYASNSYAMYTALADNSETFGHDDKQRFRGVADEAAEVVHIIRAVHPGTAEKVDSFRVAVGRVTVPPLKERIPGEAHLSVDHGQD